MTTRTEFEMKQDDWIEACQKIDDLEARLATVQSQLNLAVEALEYILEHELYHGVNEGRLSEDVAREAIAKIKETK